MPENTSGEPIRIPGEHWVEFHDTAINLTGIPDDQFRSVDDDGNPLVETESMDRPLLEFHDTAINLTGIPDDQFRSVDDDGNPAVETESMDYPLIDLGDLPVGAGDATGDNTVTFGQIPRPGANGTARPPVPPGVPPKSV